MKLVKLQVQDMWSLGQTPVVLTDFTSINIVIGKNNSGKSNILHAINWFGSQAAQPWLGNTDPFNLPHTVEHRRRGKAKAASMMSATFSLGSIDFDDLRRGLVGAAASAEEFNMYATWLKADILFRYDSSLPQNRSDLAVSFGDGTPLNNPTNAPSGIVNKWRGQPLNLTRNFLIQLFRSRVVNLSGWRSLNDDQKKIIKDLRVMQAPPTSEEASMLRFATLERFFRELTGLSNAQLKIEPSNEVINVHYNDRYLPLTSFGDGIHHLLLMAYYFARHTEHVFLIEEPETHLHPEMQRRLLNFVRANPNGNQYFFTTHSPALLDSFNDCAVFRTTYDGHETTVTRCETSEHIRELLDLLDVRASDLLQTNIAIWVEGPTDRMFLLHCLRLLAPQFEEGLNFQIVCYGGRLLSYVTIDEELKDWVNLLRLSRRVVVVCDSDKESENDTVNETKGRLEAECANLKCMFWQTDGREVENYLPDAVLTAAYRKMLDRPDLSIVLPKFENLHAVLEKQFPNPGYGEKGKVDYRHHKAAIMPHLLESFDKAAIESNHNRLHDKLKLVIDQINLANPPINPNAT